MNEPWCLVLFILVVQLLLVYQGLQALGPGNFDVDFDFVLAA